MEEDESNELTEKKDPHFLFKFYFLQSSGCCSEMVRHPWVAEKRFHTGGLPFLSYINRVAVLTAKFTQLQCISVHSS